MSDIKFIRENSELVKEAARKKSVSVDIDHLLELDKRRRELISQVDALRAEQNKGSKVGPKNPAELEELKKLKERIKVLEEEYSVIEKEFNELMLLVPNVPDPSVPDGKTDADNKEIKTWGKIPKFNFQPKDYIALMKDLDLVDSERGAKVSGFRGYFLKNEAVQLSFALLQFTLDHLIKKGFTPLISPAIARESNFTGTDWLPQGKDELYKAGNNEY